VLRFRPQALFANVWQIPPLFAKHWQNRNRRAFSFLPSFGKFAPVLPNIGKIAESTEKRRFDLTRTRQRAQTRAMLKSFLEDTCLLF